MSGNERRGEIIEHILNIMENPAVVVAVARISVEFIVRFLRHIEFDLVIRLGNTQFQMTYKRKNSPSESE